MVERRKLETILLENNLVTQEQLTQIVNYARAVGIDLYEAVLQRKIASPDAVMMAYAESVGLPFMDISNISIDDELIARIDPVSVRQYSFVPLSIDHGHVLLATTKPVIPDVEEELRMVFNMPVRCVISTPAELNGAIAKYFPRGAAPIDKAERGKFTQQQPAEKKPKNAEPMSDEEIKNRFLMSFMSFNFSVFLVCFVMYTTRIPPGIHNTWYQFPLLALIGVAVGGIVAFATWKVLSR